MVIFPLSMAQFLRAACPLFVRTMVRTIREVAGDSPVVVTGDFNAQM